jgi:hypothetical protein
MGAARFTGFNQLLSSESNPQANIGRTRKSNYFVRTVARASYRTVNFSASAPMPD